MTNLTLIENAELYAPEPRGRCSFLVGGERLLWIGDEAPDLPAALECARLDLEGRRVIPGLVDPHAHVLGGGCEAGPASSLPPMPAARFLDAGVTTVVGVLGTDDLVRTPTQLVYAVRGLREQGMSAWCYTGGYHLPPPTVTGSVRGDIVTVDAIVGIGEVAISDHRSSQPARDELLRLAAEAHVGGLMAGKAGVLHLHLGAGDRGLGPVRECLEVSELPVRVFYPTHVERNEGLLGEAIELMRSGAVIDVTAEPEYPGAEMSARRAVELLLEEEATAGAWTVSSDAGGSLPVFDDEGRVVRMEVGGPESLLALLLDLVDAGYPLEEVLPGFTCHAADHLRLPGKGRLTVGGDADFVVLDDAARTPHAVWSRGMPR